MGILTNGAKIGETLTDVECRLLRGVLIMARYETTGVGQ
jgi:hypothetical protein